jgi:hypothetical protein
MSLGDGRSWRAKMRGSDFWGFRELISELNLDLKLQQLLQIDALDLLNVVRENKRCRGVGIHGFFSPREVSITPLSSFLCP